MAKNNYKEIELKGKEGAQALYKALGDANAKVVSGGKKKSTPAKNTVSKTTTTKTTTKKACK